ncbi:MAG: transglycosylase SLT domain-containing protein, partial [Candidatus Berkiella sp.]
MTWHKWILTASFFGSLLLGAKLLAHPLPPDDIVSQRDIYIRAEHAFKKHDYVNFEKLSTKITTYPLYPYLMYDDLKRKIQSSASIDATNDKIVQFKANFPDFPFQNALDNLWLTKLAKHKQWDVYIKNYKPSMNEELACYYHYAQYELSKDNKHLQNAKELWLVGYSQANGCDKLFNAWRKTGGLTQNLIWKRFKLALEVKNENLCKYLIKQMASPEKQAATLWLKLSKEPQLVLTEKFQTSLNVPNKIKAQIMTYGLQQLAKKNPIKTLTWWQKNATSAKFSKLQSAMIERDIAVYLCHQRNKHAKEWLASLQDNAIDNVAREWRVRLALIDNDWPHVLKLIQEFPQELKEDKAWRYWLARAQEATGNQEQAIQIYQQLAQSRNYYGFVSSLRLSQPVSIAHRESPVDPHTLHQINQLNAIKRFKELNHVGKDAVARVEWFRALDKMKEDEIIGAAKLAQQLGYHDIAIFTMARAEFKDDVPLRFPLAFRQEILANANKHNIDPAWIFGIARQESAFFSDAVSHAGARGLLQLLPSTA